MKIAFVFSGQGAQYLGMGQSLERFECCKRTFAEASEVLGFDINGLFGDEKRLAMTEFAQPAILAHSVACARLCAERGITADYAAGLSLGEYSALVYSGAISFPDAVALVRKRGRFMTEAVPAGKGGMSAVLLAPDGAVERACENAAGLGCVSVANYNAPGQTVISGELGALEKAEKLALEYGAKKIVRLAVSGPFHTVLLAPAAEKLRSELEKLRLSPISVPVFANTTARPVSDENLIENLTLQIQKPVRWDETVKNLSAAGVTRYIECGPGKTLCSFIKKIDKTAEVFSVDENPDFLL